MFVCFSFMMQICSYIPTTLPKTDPLMVPLKSSQLSTSFVLETFIHAKEKVTYNITHSCGYGESLYTAAFIGHIGICLSVFLSIFLRSATPPEQMNRYS